MLKKFTLSPRVLLALVTTCLSLLLSGCTGLAFFTANARASLGIYSRIPELKYGPGARNRLDIYLPPGVEPTPTGHIPAPVVVFIHGGGWNSGDKIYYKFVGAALAEQGFVAVLPNYSLYPKAKFPAFVNDIARAIVWTHTHAAEYGGDAQRLFIIGHSAGAQIATLVALDQHYLAMAGGDARWIQGVVGLAGPYDFIPFKYPYMNALFGPPSEFPHSQPINYVRRDAPPMLLLQGLKDTTVAPGNTRQLATALRQSGVNATDIYYPQATHGDLVAAFSPLARKRAPVLKAVTDFIDEPSATITTTANSVTSATTDN
jgi:acetyl esterase/lipase